MLPAIFRQSGSNLLQRLTPSDEDKAIFHICLALTPRERLARAMAERIGDSTICGAASFLTFSQPSRLVVDEQTEALYNVRTYTSPDRQLSVLTANRDMIGGLARGLQAEHYALRDIYIKYKDTLVFGITNSFYLCSNFPVGFIKPRKEWITALLDEAHRVSAENNGVATGIETDPTHPETFRYGLFQVEMPQWDKKNVKYDDSITRKAASFYGDGGPSGSPTSAAKASPMIKGALAELAAKGQGITIDLPRPETTFTGSPEQRNDGLR